PFGSLGKSGTESKAISGAPCWASAGVASSARQANRSVFIEASLVRYGRSLTIAAASAADLRGRQRRPRALSQIARRAIARGCSGFRQRAKFRPTQRDLAGFREPMAKIEDRAPQAKTGSAANDDIGEKTRLALYRTQVVLREAEQRAFD